MPTVCLRAVDYARWVEEKPADVAPDDAPAWCLKNLSPSTGDGTLSLYLIPADQADRVAPVVAAAIVAGGNELEHAEYLLFDATVLDNVGLTAAPVMGQTPVADVNRLHAEVPISARSAAALAGAMYGRAVPTLELKPNVKKHLLAALREGRLDVSRITSGKVKKELGIGA